MSNTTEHTNALIHETSPYLLQHAHNPVDWRPWNDEALALAEREDKPIFLSVGYSTCHWCHVMAHESFEHEDVARVLNEHFVPIKVDREQRPDIDEQYMLATQLFTRRGGWPNSVWLTPDGRPWYAGTYFPREDRGAHAGFISVLKQLADAWRNNREQVEAQARQFVDAIEQVGRGTDPKKRRPLSPDIIDNAHEMFAHAYDSRHGGFGGSTKFSPHGVLDLLLRHVVQTGDEKSLQMVTRTLDAMALGGLFDHVGGGFHRYSTDAMWFLPHFEKMLYDNAQLIDAYTRAAAITGDAKYERVVADVFAWLGREMTDEAGGFYAALDADSEGEEGKFFVWSYDELIDVLGEDDGQYFAARYNATEQGTYYEAATGHRPGTNHLYLDKPLGDDELERVEALKAKLLAVRSQRVPPHLDDKVLTSWNGMMIAALARAGRQFQRVDYIEAAERAAQFLLETMWDADEGLTRDWRRGQKGQPGYLDDYAHFADALLQLNKATGKVEYHDAARALAEQMIDRFYDPQQGGFFFTSASHSRLMVRTKELGGGGNVPSPNAVAARVLTRLALLDGSARYTALARQTLACFTNAMVSQPRGCETLITAYTEQRAAGDALPGADCDVLAVHEPVTVTVQRHAEDDHTNRLEINLTIAPNWHVYAHDAAGDDRAATRLTLESEDAALDDVQYPAGRTMDDAVLGRSVDVYRGQVHLEATVRRGDASQRGPLALTLHVQPCDDRRCLEPIALALHVPG